MRRTTCRYCGLDIEGPWDKAWLDRGRNSHCPTLDTIAHKPYREGWRAHAVARLSPAQARLYQCIARCDPDGIAYWDAVNDATDYDTMPSGFVMDNINRTTAALLRTGLVRLDPDGYFYLTEP